VPDQLTQPPPSQRHHDTGKDRGQAGTDPQQQAVDPPQEPRQVAVADQVDQLLGGQGIAAVTSYPIYKAHGEAHAYRVIDDGAHLIC